MHASSLRVCISPRTLHRPLQALQVLADKDMAALFMAKIEDDQHRIARKLISSVIQRPKLTCQGNGNTESRDREKSAE